MVKSILDTDLYKFSMSYAYMKNYPEAEGVFEFNDRNNTVYNEEFLTQLDEAFHKMTDLSLTNDEYEWCIKNIPYIPTFYWDWLKTFRFDINAIDYYLDKEGHLHITVQDYLYKATLYEVPILTIVSELYNCMKGNKVELGDYLGYLDYKLETANANHISFSEFGTRRRFSYGIQAIVIDYIKHFSLTCVGTSNVHFAMKYGMTPIGTMAHEFIMFHGAIFGYKQANYLMMESWVNTFDGALGIALTDTYTSDIFFRNFSCKHGKLFDGIRQDSGNEYEFIENAINRYKALGINPLTKTIVFSNALNFNKALKIKQFCENRIQASFGIGTNLTCDVPNSANIVMKLKQCRMNANQQWEDCIKVSDDFGKHCGNSKEMKIFNLTFNK
nr:MAG TPA: nicotinate phosphoribosyltransferase [Caudoviricetes sp.]